jgi:hypothetical protein
MISLYLFLMLASCVTFSLALAAGEWAVAVIWFILTVISGLFMVLAMVEEE